MNQPQVYVCALLFDFLQDFPGGSDGYASVYNAWSGATMRETRVQSLGQEDPLEKEMAIHSSTLAWKIPWTEEPGRLHVVHEVAKSRTRLSDFTSLHSFLNLPPTSHPITPL